MSAPGFGDQVLVDAEAVRVIGTIAAGTAPIRQSMSARDQFRYERVEFNDTTWPGEPVPLAWEPGPERYQLAPALSAKAVVRVRRLVRIPQVGMVVGCTWKQEGVIRPGGDGEAANLTGPGRRVVLCEVALPTEGKARIILARAEDLRVLVRATAMA